MKKPSVRAALLLLVGLSLLLAAAGDGTVLPVGAKYEGTTVHDGPKGKKRWSAETKFQITERDKSEFVAEMRIVDKDADPRVVELKGTVVSDRISAKVTKLIKGQAREGLLDAKWVGELKNNRTRLLLETTFSDGVHATFDATRTDN